MSGFSAYLETRLHQKLPKLLLVLTLALRIDVVLAQCSNCNCVDTTGQGVSRTCARLERDDYGQMFYMSCYASCCNNACSNSAFDCRYGGCGYDGQCDQRSGKCYCSSWYKGPKCEFTTCIDKYAPACSGHGTCKQFSGANDVCECQAGYTGATCQTKLTCKSDTDCSGHGSCDSRTGCKCQTDWTGTKCNVWSCTSRASCSDNGNCVSGKCICDSVKWTGAQCNQPDTKCASDSDCSNGGACVSQVCNCAQGFSGPYCSKGTCGSEQDCNGGWTGNTCDNGVCNCVVPFVGSHCADYSLTCQSDDDCSNNGKCNSNFKCECNPGFSGITCNKTIVCSSREDCAGHGDCVNGACRCDINELGTPIWTGPTCDTQNGGGVFSCDGCNSAGACTSNETMCRFAADSKSAWCCTCKDGYSGAHCENYNAGAYLCVFSCPAVGSTSAYYYNTCIQSYLNVSLSRPFMNV